MVRLLKMSREDFENYLSNAVIEYASEKVKECSWSEKEAFIYDIYIFDEYRGKGMWH